MAINCLVEVWIFFYSNIYSYYASMKYSSGIILYVSHFFKLYLPKLTIGAVQPLNGLSPPDMVLLESFKVNPNAVS